MSSESMSDEGASSVAGNKSKSGSRDAADTIPHFVGRADHATRFLYASGSVAQRQGRDKSKKNGARTCHVRRGARLSGIL